MPRFSSVELWSWPRSFHMHSNHRFHESAERSRLRPYLSPSTTMEKGDFSSMQGLIQEDNEGGALLASTVLRALLTGLATPDSGADFQRYMPDIASSVKQIEAGIKMMAESSKVQRKVEADEIKELTKSGPGADARSSSGVVVVVCPSSLLEKAPVAS